MQDRIERVEDLEVYRRAYRVSLEVHRASLELPRIEQFGGSAPPIVQIDLRQPRRGLRQAEPFCGGVPALPDGRDRQQRRDAAVAALLRRSRLCRGSCGAAVDRRLRRDQQDVAGSPRQLVALTLTPDPWFLIPEAVAERSVDR